MKYNTQEKNLPMPEYGRAVQKMVDHAITIEDRAERQRCANTIIAVMGNMYPQLRDMPDFKHKLWDHLAVMADFKLDIDYPYEVSNAEALHPTPQRIEYPKGNIRYLHYGRCVQEMIQKACEMPEGEERMQLLRLIAAQMKKEYILWNKENVEDRKIFEDIYEYSNGQIRLDADQLNLGVYRAPSQQNQKNQKNRNGQYRKNKKKH
ncbi:MAG: DUF4290 domain-containing protein [Bacteroidaceae bacterium]|nr:DUF4290 domain-containing protein [Bacteroidaceae bacterium]